MSTLELFSRLQGFARGNAIAAREVGLGASAAVSYADLWKQVLHASAGLHARMSCRRQGAAPVVVLITGNRVEYVAAALSVWHAGCTLLPMHASVAEKELRAAAEKTRAALVVIDPRHALLAHCRDACRPLAGVDVITLDELLNPGTNPAAPSEPCAAGGLMLQSSGTTGLPKIVHRPASAIDAVARNVAEAAGLRTTDRIFAAAPICHAYGIENGFLGPLWAGGTVHLCDGLDLPVAMAEFAGASTVFPGVPFMFEVLAKTQGPVRPCSLRLAYSAGGMLPPPVARGFEERFGVGVGQLYGASELGSVTFRHAGTGETGSVGAPMDGVRIVICDADAEDISRPLPAGEEGLVAINAPSMMHGYVQEAAPLVGGFFMTGDLGRLTPDGELVITGRLKQMIDIGGMKVNPAEVEAVVAEHPGVMECVVVPVAITPTVSRLKAIIVAGPGGVDAEAIRRHVRSRLPAHKVPRVVEVVAALPRSPSGKVLRCQLETSA